MSDSRQEQGVIALGVAPHMVLRLDDHRPEFFSGHSGDHVRLKRGIAPAASNIPDDDPVIAADHRGGTLVEDCPA